MNVNRRRFLQLGGGGAAKALAGGATNEQPAAAPVDPRVLADAKAHAKAQLKRLFKDAATHTGGLTGFGNGLKAPTSMLTIHPEENILSEQLDAYADLERKGYEALQKSVADYIQRYGEVPTAADFLPPKDVDYYAHWVMRKLLPSEDAPVKTTHLTAENLKPPGQAQLEDYKAWIDVHNRTQPHMIRLVETVKKKLLTDGYDKRHVHYEAEKIVKEAITNILPLETHGLVNEISHDLPQALQVIEARGDQCIAAKLASIDAKALSKTVMRETKQQRILNQINKDHGNVVSAINSKTVFFALADNKAAALHKLGLVQELIGKEKLTDEFPKLKLRQGDTIVEDIEPRRQWPQDRYVPVPTQEYTLVYGVELSFGQLQKIQKFLEEHPYMASALKLSEFGQASGKVR